MIELNGKFANAKVFTDKIEDTAMSQIIQLLNQPFVEGAKIRIMPDTHAGKGCVIGFTAEMKDKVIPSTIGVDLGCGMFVAEITGFDVDLVALDKFIHENIPAGYHINEHEKINAGFADGNYKNLRCYDALRNQGSFGKAIGSLGGGNHFIEIDVSDKSGKVYLVIHTGSRNLGKQVAEYYQKVAVDLWKFGGIDYKEQREKIIKGLRDSKKGYQIPAVLNRLEKEFKSAHPQYPADLCFLYGQKMQDYLYDMRICQAYASQNRFVIGRLITEFLNIDILSTEFFETVHNYISFKDNIMRKGAVSAHAGEILIIPINMRDGSLICVGKGNDDWNQSAPHGAGRIMSRAQAKREIKMEDYELSMDGIFTTCVDAGTLDESPMAYKPMVEIIENIKDTVDIIDIIRPIYNFKAGGE